MKRIPAAVFLTLLLAGGTACGGSDQVQDAPLAPPRLLLLVERADDGSDAALDARLSTLANDTAARGRRIIEHADGVPARTLVLYEPAYEATARDLALLFGLEDDRLVPQVPGTREAAIVLSLGADFDLQTLELRPAVPEPAIPPEELAALGYGEGTVVYVDISLRRATLFVEGEPVKSWPVAVGKPETPTPPGVYKIIRLKEDPVWSWEGRRYPPGDPDNGLGTRWVGINLPTYGMHGTNEPDSIGGAESHGCVRSLNVDIEEVFEHLSLGDTVIWAE